MGSSSSKHGGAPRDGDDWGSDDEAQGRFLAPPIPDGSGTITEAELDSAHRVHVTISFSIKGVPPGKPLPRVVYGISDRTDYGPTFAKSEWGPGAINKLVNNSRVIDVLQVVGRRPFTGQISEIKATRLVVENAFADSGTMDNMSQIQLDHVKELVFLDYSHLPRNVDKSTTLTTVSIGYNKWRDLGDAARKANLKPDLGGPGALLRIGGIPNLEYLYGNTTLFAEKNGRTIEESVGDRSITESAYHRAKHVVRIAKRQAYPAPSDRSIMTSDMIEYEKNVLALKRASVRDAAKDGKGVGVAQRQVLTQLRTLSGYPGQTKYEQQHESLQRNLGRT